MLLGPLLQEKLPGILRLFAAAAQGSLTHTHYRWGSVLFMPGDVVLLCLASSACLTCNLLRLQRSGAPLVCTALTTSLPPPLLFCLHSYAKHDEVVTLAQMLRHLPLSLREAWTFAISPTDPDDVSVRGCVPIPIRGVSWALCSGHTAQESRPSHTPLTAAHLDPPQVASALLGFATAYAARRRVTPASILLPPMVEARSELELQQVGSTARLQHATGGWVVFMCGRQQALAMACQALRVAPT